MTDFAASSGGAAGSVAGAALVGKLPAHGDFVARGLDPGTRDAIDRWLSDAMTRARAAHGDAFDARYERARPWRFAFPHDGGWTAGALALSADASGRRFPLYGERAASREDAGAAADAVEAALYRAIAEGMNADAALAAIADGQVAADDFSAAAGWRDALGALAGDDPRPVDVVARMLAGADGWA